MRRIFSEVLLSIAFLSQSVTAADWPCWRGPDGLGVSTEKDLPDHWSAKENVAWSVELSGKGASSPIIVGERVYLTLQSPDQGLHLLSFDRSTGKLIWDREVGRGMLKAHELHNMATPTAVSDGKHIWALFGAGDLVCVDTEGSIVWQRNLVKEYGPYKTNHGMGPSPMLHQGRIYVTVMHQGPSYFLAVNAADGKNVWKKTRDFDAREEGKDSYSSPILVRNGGSAQFVLAGAEVVNAYNPESGEELWKLGGLNVSHPYGRTISGPTAGDGMIVAVASGFQNRGYTVGIKSGGHGDVTETHKAWTATRFAPDCPTPLIYNGLLFMIRDDGMASCLDLKTGESKWQERLFSENVKVSPVAGDGKVYFVSGRANCTVVRAAPTLEILGKSELNEDTLSSPALSKGRLFLRTTSHLYCFGK